MKTKPEYIKVDNIKYPINTDYRTALKCNRIAQDSSISDYERAMAICYTLFGDNYFECKNKGKMLDLAIEYLKCGIEDKKLEALAKSEQDMDIDQDWELIVASFRSDYGIDIEKEKMHWWTFWGLLNGLTDKCVLNRVREIRTEDLETWTDEKTKKRMKDLKEYYALKPKERPLTQKEMKSVEEFYRLTGIKRE